MLCYTYRHYSSLDSLYKYYNCFCLLWTITWVGGWHAKNLKTWKLSAFMFYQAFAHFPIKLYFFTVLHSLHICQRFFFPFLVNNTARKDILKWSQLVRSSLLCKVSRMRIIFLLQEKKTSQTYLFCPAIYTYLITSISVYFQGYRKHFQIPYIFLPNIYFDVQSSREIRARH